MSQDLAPVLPAQVTVVFRSRRCAGGIDTIVPLYNTQTIKLKDITLTDSAAVLPTEPYPGSTKLFHDTALALSPGGAIAPTNSASLQALAQQIAQDYYDWATSSFDIVSAGIIAPDPTGLHDLIEWDYGAARVTTRESSGPLNRQAEELLHQDPAITGCQDVSNTAIPVAKTPGVEFYGPPQSCTSGGATATATIAGGGVASINVTNGGSDYTSAPTVQFSQGDGTGAVAIANLGAGPTAGTVVSVTIVSPGSGYSRPPIVSFSGGANKLQVTRYVMYLHDGRLTYHFVSTDCLAPSSP